MNEKYENGKLVYQNLGNGIEVFDAECYNRPMADAARNIRNALLLTAIFAILLFAIFWGIPYVTEITHTGFCSVAPHWPWRGGCP